MMEWLQNQSNLQQHPTIIMLSILNKALCYVQQWRSTLDVVVVLVVVVVVVFLHIRADSGGNRGRACCCWQQWCCCFCCCTRKFRLHTHTLYEFLCRKDNQLPFLSFYFVFVLGANSGMLFLASTTQLKRSMPFSSDTRAALVLVDLTSWTFCSSKWVPLELLSQGLGSLCWSGLDWMEYQECQKLRMADVWVFGPILPCICCFSLDVQSKGL